MYSFLRTFFFNDTATTEIYTLSLHDALPIFFGGYQIVNGNPDTEGQSYALSWVLNNSFLNLPSASGIEGLNDGFWGYLGDRKSTRLNSSHANISYAVFCLKKKNNTATVRPRT